MLPAPRSSSWTSLATSRREDAMGDAISTTPKDFSRVTARLGITENDSGAIRLDDPCSGIPASESTNYVRCTIASGMIRRIGYCCGSADAFFCCSSAVKREETLAHLSSARGNQIDAKHRLRRPLQITSVENSPAPNCPGVSVLCLGHLAVRQPRCQVTFFLDSGRPLR